MGKCQICGKATKFNFPLCSDCNNKKEQGLIFQDENGKWTVKEEPKETTTENKSSELTCLICGKPSNGKPQCKDCYYEMIDYKESLDKNLKSFELKDYYYKLKSNIYRMKTFDYIKSNCNKLLAIALLLKENYKDESLINRAHNEIKEIIETKKPIKEEKITEYTKAKDTHKEEIIRTKDGHYVKSSGESEIDDILYDLRIVHCYEKNVPINADEEAITCDWFIPIKDNRHGIYIEYWGMNTESYKKNKERKRKTYKDHDIPLIEIEKEDYKDKQGLSDRIIREINSLAKKHFKIEEFID